MKGLNQQEIIDKCRAGHREALESVVNQYSESLYKCIFSVLRDPREAEDLVQEVYVRFMEKIRGPDRIESIPAWLNRVGKNLAIDRFRQRKRRGMTSLDQVDQDGGATPDELDDLIDRGKLLKAFHLALQSFRPEIRAVLAAYLYGLNIPQISEFLEMKTSEVNNIWTRNRIKLYDLITNQLKGDWRSRR